MTAHTAQNLVTTHIVAMEERTSKRGNTYYIATLAGVAQPVTIFADDAKAIKAAWASFERVEGKVKIPLIITTKRDADQVIEGVTVPGYTNYTAKLQNVMADVCPF